MRDGMMSVSRRVGVLAEANSVIFSWSGASDCLQNCGSEVVFLVEKPIKRPRRRWRDLPARMLWRIVSRMEQYVLGWSPERFAPMDAVELPCEFNGHFKDFPQESIQRLAALRLDLIIRLGGRGIYRGAILGIVPDGLLSVHHGDNRKFRGGPPGFWEILAGEPECGFIIQRLTGTLDGGEVFARGAIATAPLATVNLQKLYAAADNSMAIVLAQYLESGVLAPSEAAVPALGPIYRMPSLAALLKYVWRSWILQTMPRPRNPK